MMPAPAVNTIRRVCVFCGSRVGVHPEYRSAAEELGLELVRRGYGLVYGGGSIGMMGVLADAVLAAGGEVIGVIPEHLATRELLHPRVSDMRITRSMHERKALMEQLCDAFIAAPGGYGTWEELMEIITWSQLGLHSKPIGLLNTRDAFGPFIRWVEAAINDGFIKPRNRDIWRSAPSPSELLDVLASHQVPASELSIRADET